jgi:hypothetical protein
MAEQGTIMEKIVVETEVKLFLGMVRFDFIQRSLVAEVNKVLEVKITEENVLALHVLDRLSQVDWDSSRLIHGYEQSMERVKNWMWKFGVHEWILVESESWFDRWRKMRKLECNTSELGSSDFLKQREYDAEHPFVGELGDIN